MTTPLGIPPAMLGKPDPLKPDAPPTPDSKIHLTNIDIAATKRGIRPYRIPVISAIERDAPSGDLSAIMQAMSALSYCMTVTTNLAEAFEANDRDESRTMNWRMSAKRDLLDNAREDIKKLSVRADAAISKVHTLRTALLPHPTDANATLRHIEIRSALRSMSGTDRRELLNESIAAAANQDRGAIETLVAAVTAPALFAGQLFGTNPKEREHWLARLSAAVDPETHRRILWLSWAFETSLDGVKEVAGYLDAKRAGATPGASVTSSAPSRAAASNRAR